MDDCRDATPTLDDIIDALRDELADGRRALSDLRNEPITASLVDELAALRFRWSRLHRRLRSLESDGLLTLSARRRECIRSILTEAVDEIGEEAARRDVELTLDVSDAPGLLWLDADQVRECVRCALDDGLARLRRGGRLDVRLVADASGAIVTVVNDGDGPGDALALQVLMRVCSEPWTGLQVEVGDAGACIRLRVRSVEPDRVVHRPCVTRRWVFPTPSAA